MLATGSAVYKMTNNILDERKIISLPRPYLISATPNKQVSFSPLIYEATKILTLGISISKVIFVGDVAVGKTSLVNRFCHKIFETNYKATIGVDFEVERFNILNNNYNLQIWDTAGQERFRCIARSYYRGASAIVLVFSLCDPVTLENTTSWLTEALKSANLKPLIFLVGTKKDKISSSSYMKIEKNAITLANELKAEYWAISSKTGDCVNEFFNRLAALTFEKVMERDFHDYSHVSKASIGNPLHLGEMMNLQPKVNNCSGKCSKS